MNKSEAGRLGGLKWAEVAKKSKDERIAAYECSPQPCAFCGGPIPYERHRRKNYCGSSCSTKDAHRNFPGKLKRKRIRNYCSGCDAVHEMPSGNLCRKCAVERKAAAGSINVRTTLKSLLFKQRGRSCERCCLAEWMGQPIPLELDHIDGNAANNLLDNLRILCANCHGQTPTAKGKNKGNGRKSRGIPRH